MLLKVTGISKRFGARPALEGVSFSVHEGEVLGLIGPNGAGKTTLFECLAGLTPADAGEVEFRHQSLAPARRKQALFYLPDGIRPWADQTVGFALSFFEGLYARPAGEGAELVNTLKLEKLVKARIGSLSKGECKRTLLALGLLTSQPLLLLDEPFDGLDLRQARDVMTLLRTYTSKGRTLFLSIHQLTDAARVCDRLVLLGAGKVAGEGTLAELQMKAGLTEGGLEEVFLALT
ncbi:MAG TPA: ABC transporter ATP-binding protein [Blastocatellia bacterium]|nr:ABC transporter ATP-binding protein [Blastocatellia bacterium]